MYNGWYIMNKEVRRGYFPSDKNEFGIKSIEKLNKSAKNLYYLINEGYNVKSASTFVGNHYLLSERQRLALARAVSSQDNINMRKSKEIRNNLEGITVNIDGFNTIITLEVALSNSTLLKCMDGTIRDLAGLRGTYRIIDKTEKALKLIGDILEKEKIRKAIFYLDAPVSNSGNLKKSILNTLSIYDFEVEVHNINNVDGVLEKLENVITSDAIILDRCGSWINLNRKIIEGNVDRYSYVDFIY